MYMIPYTRRSNSSMMDLFDELERSMFGESGRRTPVFSTDIRDEGAHYLLQADLPGFRKEDIDLDVKDGVLTISAKHQADDRTANAAAHTSGDKWPSKWQTDPVNKRFANAKNSDWQGTFNHFN